MEIQARGKINWTLNIVGRRADGYHLLDMLMQPIALCDTLLIEPADSLSLTIDGAPGLCVRHPRASSSLLPDSRLRLARRLR